MPRKRTAKFSARARRLAADNMRTVALVVKKTVRTLPPWIDKDDLTNAGVLGLLEAAERYDPKRGNQFATFAKFRIRGAVLDELRARDTLSRDMRRRMTMLQGAGHELAIKLLRPATADELAVHIGVSLDELWHLMSTVTGQSVVGYDDVNRDFLSRHPDESSPSPEAAAIASEAVVKLLRAIEELPPRLAYALSLYYVEDLHLKEIGGILGVTESRVCQLHGQALALLRELLGAN